VTEEERPPVRNPLHVVPDHIQKAVVCILLDEASEPLGGRTYVQKLMFLFQQRTETDYFEFDPMDYGPSSKELYRILDDCIEDGYVAEIEKEDDHGRVHYHYETGDEVSVIFVQYDDEELRETASAVVEEYPTDDLQALLEDVYSEYPKWARNSIY
jgi:uncharacterized protein YwgA